MNLFFVQNSVSYFTLKYFAIQILGAFAKYITHRIIKTVYKGKMLLSSLFDHVWHQRPKGSFQFQVYSLFKKDIKGLIFWHHRLNCNWKPLGKRIPLDVVIIASNLRFLLNSFSTLFSCCYILEAQSQIMRYPHITLLSFLYPHKSALNDGLLKSKLR